MRGMFPEYEEHSQREFADAWSRGIFVFDTNVLLNLYRYQSSTRDELINVLTQLKKRIWLPHHVALEFQRNGIDVVSEQNKRFGDVRRAIEKARAGLASDLEKLQLQKRHTLINPTPLMEGFDKLIDTFLSELESLRKNQQRLTGHDPLKKNIEDLFDGRVGSAPATQEALNEIYKVAEARYKIGTPPGYRDIGKSELREYVNNGIIYKNIYGDYLIWDQMLSHSKEKEVKQLLFITDDAKDDWWWVVDSEGPKTIGPRPELKEEARIKGGVQTFLMYSSEGFLQYAKEFLKAHVSEETIREVRDVSMERSSTILRRQRSAARAERAVLNWLLTEYSVIDQSADFPDFIARKGDLKFGFEVKYLRDIRSLNSLIIENVYRAIVELNTDFFEEINIIIVVDDVDIIEKSKVL